VIEKIDKYWIGILLGLIMPAVVAYLYIDQFNLWSSIRVFGLQLGETWSKLLMVSVFPNLAFIYVFYTLDAWKLSKGLLIGAFPYIIAATVFAI